MAFKDDCVVLFLEWKSGPNINFVEFKSLVQTKTGKKIKALSVKSGISAFENSSPYMYMETPKLLEELLVKLVEEEGDSRVGTKAKKIGMVLIRGKSVCRLVKAI